MTPYLWVLFGGFVLGVILLVVFGLMRKVIGTFVGVFICVVCLILFCIDITVDPYKNGYEPPEEEIGTASFSEIYYAYKENELVADEKYKNNRYRVTAIINGMTNDGLFNLTGGATLTMETQVDNTIVIFYAEFEKEQEEALKTVKVGDTITFEGECLSAGSWVECELITQEE